MDVGTYIHVSVMSNMASAVPTKLPAPERVTAALTEVGEVTLQWTPVQFADHYEVHLFDNTDKVYKKVGSSKDTECKISSLKTDVTATFRITAVAEFNDYEFSSDYSPNVSCKVLSGPPAAQQLSAAQTADKVKISWSAVKGADRYNIYAVSPTAGTEDELLGTSDTTSFTADNLTKGRVYRVYVRAVKANGDYTLTGEPSNVIIVDIPAEKTYIIGDVDGNGAVDILDSTFVQRYATGINTPVSSENMMHGDIDRDGVVSIIDATFIQRFATSLTIPYPIDCPSA